MNKFILGLLLTFSVTTFAKDYSCTAKPGSLQEGIKLTLSTDAFESANYSGRANVSIEGTHDSFMSVKNKNVTYIRMENNSELPVFIVPLEFPGYGLIYVIFKNNGQDGQLQYENTNEDKTVLANFSCK